MFRIHLDPTLPMHGLVGEQDGRIAIVLNPHLVEALLTQAERVDLMNKLLSDLERMRGKVIDIKDLREKRQISLLVTAVQEQIEKKGVRRGVDTNPR